MKKKRGFTLIELLVVVLIIAILATIALPQYRTSVGKAQVQEAIMKLTALKQAEEIYYLSTGKYATDISNLDISFGELEASDWCANCRTDGKWVYKTELNWCQIFLPKKEFYIEIYYDHSTVYEENAPRRRCLGRTDLYKKVCESLGGVYFKTTGEVNYYGL
jgi:prepilin-type N-terminal cleavage/methylation domain-containing protein